MWYIIGNNLLNNNILYINKYLLYIEMHTNLFFKIIIYYQIISYT